MNVHTNTIRVLNARRTVLELMLSDHPSDCLVCAKSGNCELQSVAIKLGIREIPFEGEKTEFRVDLSPSDPPGCHEMYLLPSLRDDV